MVRLTLLIAIVAVLSACSGNQEQLRNKDISEVAGNEEVLKYMKAFEGRGDLSDTAHMVNANEAVKGFKIPADLAVELVLAEPTVTQPVFITFDPQGRLWVVQYNQYPYPEGLKVLSVDWHNRAKFDKEPLPPPSNAKGADKITMFEDTDGDGSFDKSTDVITGLNLITSVAFGRGEIWVLNPPYLLAYPDADNNGIPDGKPVVRLKGFGIEDTHAVANNLKFGPDGWLYGAQGSTCNANISSEVSKDVKFLGQAIWRYHPDTKVFEVFAEGGGNTFDVEIDSKGRLYSGDNGTSRGEYFKQGSYFVRNLGKHGEYTNPYTYGHLPNMQLTGEEVRFTHAFVRYEGASLPDKYNDYMIALNPLQSYVQLTKFEPNGSTFKTIDGERIMLTNDHWFRPVDITTGPDGNVYIADWYDSRISHIDPRDTWNKNSGRIYRLRNSETSKTNNQKFNLYTSSDSELIKLLSHKNNWYRQTALQILGDRKNKALLPLLKQMLQGNDATQSLEALWAIHL
ncbi:MAG: dehydrogenase, partial [Chitinophagaceae bacterium]